MSVCEMAAICPGEDALKCFIELENLSQNLVVKHIKDVLQITHERE